jgi:hypothetical protein
VGEGREVGGKPSKRKRSRKGVEVVGGLAREAVCVYSLLFLHSSFYLCVFNYLKRIDLFPWLYFILLVLF